MLALWSHTFHIVSSIYLVQHECQNLAPFFGDNALNTLQVYLCYGTTNTYIHSSLTDVIFFKNDYHLQKQLSSEKCLLWIQIYSFKLNLNLLSGDSLKRLTLLKFTLLTIFLNIRTPSMLCSIVASPFGYTKEWLFSIFDSVFHVISFNTNKSISILQWLNFFHKLLQVMTVVVRKISGTVFLTEEKLL